MVDGQFWPKFEAFLNKKPAAHMALDDLATSHDPDRPSGAADVGASGACACERNPRVGGYHLFEPSASEHQADIQLAPSGNFAPPPETVSECCNAPNRTGDTVEVFEPGASFSPSSTLDRYPSIGRDRTFVTEVGSIERVTGPIPDGATEIRITRQQADQLETDLGLNPGSAESSNTLSIVSDVQGRCPRCPVSGNDHFLGSGQGLPGGGSDLVIVVFHLLAAMEFDKSR